MHRVDHGSGIGQQGESTTDYRGTTRVAKMTIDVTLMLHCLCMTVVLSVAALFLWRRGLLTPFHGATWLLFAFALFFLINPALTLITGDLDVYSEALESYCSDPSTRPYWVLTVIVIGLGSFVACYAYGRNGTKLLASGLPPTRQVRWSLPTILVLLGFLAAGALGVLFYSTEGSFVDQPVATASFDRGRIVSGVTGYTVIANHFFIFPALFLVVRGPRFPRTVGFILLLGYVALRLFDRWDRASIVSLVASLALVLIALSRWSSRPRARLGELTLWGRFKRLSGFIPALGLASLLISRGHSSIADYSFTDDTVARASRELVRNDSSMLATLYARTDLAERKGFDYGVPVLTAAGFGWLPRRYFPWKDDLTDILLDQSARRTTPSDDRWIYGPKSTLIGSFYDHGGGLAVVLGMILVGLALRWLDHLVSVGKTDMGRCVGMMWMGQIWMMFGSSDIWIMNGLFTSGLPFFVLMLIAKFNDDNSAVVAPSASRGFGSRNWNMTEHAQ